jgi:hypothetical protein
MDIHGIDVSVRFPFFRSQISFKQLDLNSTISLSQVVSLANPWLDFLDPEQAITSAHALNLDLQEYCSTYSPSSSASESGTTFQAQTRNRLFAFGSLPLVPGVKFEKVLEAIEQIQGLSYLRGVVMGTKGLGKGLDDPEMDPIWEALDKAGLVSFIVCSLSLLLFLIFDF